MTEPRHHLIRAVGTVAFRHVRPGNHDHRQAQAPRSQKLGLTACAAAVLGDDQINRVLGQKRTLACLGKRRTAFDHRAPRQRKLGMLGFNDPGQIPMLGPRLIRRKYAPTDGQENPRRLFGQRFHGGVFIRDLGPAIFRPGAPGRTLQCDQMHVRVGRGFDSIPAHPSREGMRRVHQMRDPFVLQIGTKTSDAAKAAHTHRQGLRIQGLNASGIGKDSLDPRGGQGLGQLGGPGRTAQKKNFHG